MEILISILIIVVLGFLLYLASKEIKKKSEIIKQKDYAIETAAQNIKSIMEYDNKLKKIVRDKLKTDKKIMEAETDEEVISIVNDIISNNNSKLSND